MPAGERCSRGSTTSSGTPSGSTSCRARWRSTPHAGRRRSRRGPSTCAAGWALRPGQAPPHGAHRPRARPATPASSASSTTGASTRPGSSTPTVDDDGDGSTLTMRLHYGGRLWMPALDRLLADEIERSRPRLLACLAARPAPSVTRDRQLEHVGAAAWPAPPSRRRRRRRRARPRWRPPPSTGRGRGSRPADRRGPCR